MDNWIVKRRLTIGISQTEFVERLTKQGLAINRATASQWERGRNNPPIDNPDVAKVIANALEWSVLDLLIAVGYDIQIEIDSKEWGTQSIQAAEIIEKLPNKHVQQTAVNMLHHIADELRAFLG